MQWFCSQSGFFALRHCCLLVYFSALLFCSLLLLFGFSTYLDFDDSFEFQVKLGSFFLCLGIVAHRFRLFAVACLRGCRLSFVPSDFALTRSLSHVQTRPFGHFSKPNWRCCIFVVTEFFVGRFFLNPVFIFRLSPSGLFYRQVCYGVQLPLAS